MFYIRILIALVTGLYVFYLLYLVATDSEFEAYLVSLSKGNNLALVSTEYELFEKYTGLLKWILILFIVSEILFITK